MKTRSYDANGFLNGYTDWKGNQTKILNNTRGLAVSMTEAVGTSNERTILTTWHEYLNVPLTITEPKRKIDFTYTETGQLLTRTVTDLETSESRTTSYTYYPEGTHGKGLIATIDGSRSDVNDITQYAYNATDGLISVTNALGHTILITEHDPSGRPLSITDANGIQMTLRWDQRGRLTQSTLDGKVTNYVYDALGQLTRVTLADDSYLEYTYDNAHRLTRIRDNDGDQLNYTLDSMGNHTKTETSDNVSTITHTQQSIFDKLNRLQQSLGANGQQLNVNYDNNHNPVDQNDALSRKSLGIYDELDRLIRSVDPDNKATQLSYDAQDNLTKVIDAEGLETRYSYNGFDEVTSQTNPNTGLSLFSYDTAGNKIRMTDARGITVNYRYDALNRLTEEDFADDTLDVSYVYDQGNNGIGHLTKRTDASGETRYNYDARGNLLRKTSTLQTKSYITQYRYNIADRQIGITYPNGLIVDHARDNNGRVAAITAVIDGVNQPIVEKINYLPFGPIKNLVYGNGLVESRIHDTSYRLQQITVGNVLSTQYVYNTVDNLIHITQPQDAANDQVFIYDILDRVLKETGNYGERSYSYDAIGNRTEQIKINVGTDSEGNPGQTGLN